MYTTPSALVQVGNMMTASYVHEVPITVCPLISMVSVPRPKNALPAVAVAGDIAEDKTDKAASKRNAIFIPVFLSFHEHIPDEKIGASHGSSDPVAMIETAAMEANRFE